MGNPFGSEAKTEAAKPRLMKKRQPGPLESVLMATGASLFFISWGVFVNWEHGMGAVMQVAITQGVISFVSTFLASEFLRWLYGTVRRAGLHGAWNAPLSFLIMNSLIFGAHFFAGTPEILVTMLPGLTTSVFFCSMYTYRLSVAWARREA